MITLADDTAIERGRARIVAEASPDEFARWEDGSVRNKLLYPAPASKEFLARLQNLGVMQDFDLPELPGPEDYERLALAIVALDKEVREAANVWFPRVPPRVHAHLRDQRMDSLSIDRLLVVLERAGMSLSETGRYLDFGCSTGRTIDTLHRILPDADLVGCDPARSSIRWSLENRPGISFFRSEIAPPLDVADASFDGAYANSVWSHFSESAARAWLVEMHRILRPGGFMCITSKGFAAILKAFMDLPLLVKVMGGAQTDPEFIDRVIDNLLSHGFFMTIDGYEHDEMTSPDWGQAFLTAAWVDRVAAEIGFERRATLLMGWSFRQDMHLLVKT